MSNPVIVTVNLHCGHASGSSSNTYEIDREEWDEMSPEQRVKVLDEMAETDATNQFDWGWNIDDADDMASTEGGA